MGYDNIDVDAARRRDVVVTNTPGVLTEATADLAMALVLVVTRRLGEGERIIRERQPWSSHLFFLLGAGAAGQDARYRRCQDEVLAVARAEGARVDG